MRRNIHIAMCLIILFSGLAVLPAFSQENAASVGTQETAPSAEKVEAAQAPKELSIYGEVQAVNDALNSISVQYYDYDTDDEKTAEILLDNETKMENVRSVGDIKQNDWVDVTYAVSGSKNIAKSVIVEKEEEVTMDEKAPAPSAAVPSVEE